MKKILTNLTGIVFLITILIAGGCNSASNNKNSKDSKRVKIYLKAIEEADGKHLEMYDSNKRGDKVIDSLETLVPPGSTVIWKRTLFSGIKDIVRIGSKSGDGRIFIEDAQRIRNSKRFKLEIPKDVSRDEREEYYIKFMDKKDKEETPIDPILKIP